MNTTENNKDKHTNKSEPEVNKKRPPQHVIDKMNRTMVIASETGMTPGQLEDTVYQEMFGEDE